MADYKQGSKKEVAEIKFLIHDLRVEKFINEIIHFHVTLNTDLEIYSIDQAQVLHGHDLDALKATAVSLRKAFQNYSNAVKSFSPDRTIVLAGNKYVDTISATCELILNPMWGRIDKVLTFLPADSRSVQARTHYLNCIHWIRGVQRRIVHFLEEQQDEDVYEKFDVASDIERFTRDVVYGYVAELSRGRVQIELDRLDSAILGGNRPRFRRMYFNLVMNAVDAMSNREAGVLSVSATLEGEQVVLRVRDNGSGMTEEKISELLTDKETLDGELHSLGFVFVRQTIEEFKGELSINSEEGKGTTITVAFPYLPGNPAGRGPTPRVDSNDSLPKVDIVPRRAQDPLSPQEERSASVAEAPAATVLPGPSVEAAPVEESEDRENSCGRMIYRDYEVSDAQFPGSIFGIAVTEADDLDFFTHRAYERYYEITHEDLSPMFFESTVRGRLEQDEEQKPVLTLKAPQNIREFFEFKNVPEKQRSPERYISMVHDEYIRVARKLVLTGLPPEIPVLLDNLEKFFPARDDLVKAEPFPVGLLAKQGLASEGNG
jgi:hypothetical protein